MSSTLRARVPGPGPTTLRQHHAHPSPVSSMRKVSDCENQVIPFHLDDGTDDNEEIRRRRYSSSTSSSSDSDGRHKRGGRGGGMGLARRPHARSYHEKESEWEKASSGRAEDKDDDNDDDDDDNHMGDSDSSHHEPVVLTRAVNTKLHRHELAPESPRRTGRKKTQQSESEENDDDNDDDDVDLRKDSAVSATATTSVPSSASSAPSTPRTLAVGELASLSKLAVFPGSETQLLQAHVRRVKTLLHSQYHLYIHDQLILMAEKAPKSRTPNYRLFDMTRSAAGIASKLTKKSGNYIGKLRSNFTKKKSVLIGNQSRKTELAAIIFSGNVSSSEPRRLTVVLPPINAKRQEVDGIAVGDEPDHFSVLVEHYKSLKKQNQLNANQHHIQVFENKQPVFENGFYRLNFHGRVSVPSVKNFQLVRTSDAAAHVPIVPKTAAPPLHQAVDRAHIVAARDDGAMVYLQFGKVDENKFHLDFRAPITPIQAFAIALAQFNL